MQKHTRDFTASETESQYAVAWREGGELRCRWNTLAMFFNSDEEAKAYAEEHIGKMGYKFYTCTSRFIRSIGLPIGWDATTSCFDWAYDASDRFWYHRSIRPDLFKDKGDDYAEAA